MEAYSRAHEVVGTWLAGQGGAWVPYMSALTEFEAAISNFYVGYQSAHKYLKRVGAKFPYDQGYFATNDGSPLQRINEVYNTFRHAAVAEDQPLWFTDEGLECARCRVSFAEFEDGLREHGRIAAALARGSVDGQS